MYGYDISTGEAISMLLLYLAVLITVFLIIRGIVLWYFRINEIVNELHKVTALLSRMLPDGAVTGKETNAPPFRWGEGDTDATYEKPVTKEEKDRITKNWTQKDWDRFYATGIMKPHEPEPGDKQDQ